MHFPDRTGGSCNTTYIPCTVDKADSNPARQRQHEECGDVPVESYVLDNAFTYQASLRESSANQLPHGVSDAANSLASFINPTGWGNIATGVGNEGTFVVPIGKLNGGGLVSDVNAASIYPKGGVSDLAVELSYTLLDAPLPNLEKNEMDFQDDCLANVFPRSGSPFKGLSPDSEDPFSMIHLQPLTYSDNIWEVKEKEASVSPQRNDGGKRTSQITPTLFSPLVDTLDSINGDGKKSCDRPLRNKKSASQDPEEEQRIPVVDPQRSKLHVPLSSIIPTKALGGRVSFPSLCLLYQSGRCLRGASCYQMHIEPEVVQRLRHINESLPYCCAFHGECNSNRWDAEGNSHRSILIKGAMVPLSRVAYTNGLERFVLKNNLSRSLNTCAICRLHGKPGGCRYGADCWYVHICREVLQQLASTIRLDLEDPAVEGQNKGQAKTEGRTNKILTNDVLGALSQQQQGRRKQVGCPTVAFHSSKSPVLTHVHKGGVNMTSSDREGNHSGKLSSHGSASTNTHSVRASPTVGQIVPDGGTYRGAFVQQKPPGYENVSRDMKRGVPAAVRLRSMGFSLSDYSEEKGVPSPSQFSLNEQQSITPNSGKETSSSSVSCCTMYFPQKQSSGVQQMPGGHAVWPPAVLVPSGTVMYPMLSAAGLPLAVSQQQMGMENPGYASICFVPSRKEGTRNLCFPMYGPGKGGLSTQVPMHVSL